MTHTYSITGMTCEGCVATVKSNLLKLGDVLSAEVQRDAPQATITMARHIPTARLQEALGAKYTITEADGGMHAYAASSVAADDAGTDSYYPIFLIFGYITGATLLVQWAQGGFNWMQWMSHFMAGFFLVFSFFKLLKLSAFTEGYRTYDSLAKRLPAWGYVYPFLELGLGVLFLTGIAPLATNIATLLLMGVSSVGVIQSLTKKQRFQCACLGTVIQLPLSKVTLFEDLLMVAMSAVMIAMLA